MRMPAIEAQQNGALAQLGERLLCKHQVIGSIPIGSTISQECAVHLSRMRIIRSGLAGRKHLASVFDIVNGF
jgi:hypothetical protein